MNMIQLLFVRFKSSSSARFRMEVFGRKVMSIANRQAFFLSIFPKKQNKTKPALFTVINLEVTKSF